jgi:hypothetical protein
LATCRRFCHVCKETMNGERVHLTLAAKDRAREQVNRKASLLVVS